MWSEAEGDSMTECFPAHDYRNNLKHSWCRGCSCYGIIKALSGAFAEQRIDPCRISVVSGIGCSSRMALHFDTFGLHTLHGRALPVAIGLRLANPDLPVVVVAGDGDFFSIGTNHFVHAARKNFDLMVVCIDNRRYAMTKNQSSPTSPSGHAGSLSPHGEAGPPLNVLEFAIACNASFVARTFAGNSDHMHTMFVSAMAHRGFSFVEIIAPCPTYDRSGAAVSLSSRVVELPEGASGDCADKAAALKHAERALDYDESDELPVEIGVYYKVARPVYEERRDAARRVAAAPFSLSSALQQFSI